MSVLNNFYWNAKPVTKSKNTTSSKKRSNQQYWWLVELLTASIRTWNSIIRNLKSKRQFFTMAICCTYKVIFRRFKEQIKKTLHKIKEEMQRKKKHYKGLLKSSWFNLPPKNIFMLFGHWNTDCGKWDKLRVFKDSCNTPIYILLSHFGILELLLLNWAMSGSRILITIMD